MSGGRVLVLGGGLSGISAALRCADAGAEVTLLEVRPRLGGAAYSFERDGLVLDNGQHVFLRCCDAYRGLLRRLGSEHLTEVQERLEIPVLRPGREPVVLRRGELPPPLHLAGALARYPHLRPLARLRAGLAALAMRRVDPDDPGNDAQSLGAWLAARGQDEHAVAALWDLIALPTLNLPASEASLALGAFVFRTGLLEDRAAGDIGFHRAPLAEIVGGPAERELARAGVEVRLRHRAERVRPEGAGFAVEGEQTLTADAVVVAVPQGRAAAMLPPGALPAGADPGALGRSPIINLHVLYDRPVTDLRFAAGVGTPVQYVFDRTHDQPGGGLGGSQYLAVSLSGAVREMGTPTAVLRERYLEALAVLFPRARSARVERFSVTREHAATFRGVPSSARLRPPAATRLPGLALAGAWTATGGPATMEGAVQSGEAAADTVLQALGGRAPALAEVAA